MSAAKNTDVFVKSVRTGKGEDTWVAVALLAPSRTG